MTSLEPAPKSKYYDLTLLLRPFVPVQTLLLKIIRAAAAAARIPRPRR